MISNQKAIENWLTGKSTARSRAIFYDGDTIFSYGYHFPIAVKLGGNVILITRRRYSVTTTQHTNRVFFSIPFRFKVIEVDDLQSNFRTADGRLRASWLKRELKVIAKMIEEAKQKEKRARVPHSKAGWLGEVVNLKHNSKQLNKLGGNWLALAKLRS